MLDFSFIYGLSIFQHFHSQLEKIFILRTILILDEVAVFCEFCSVIMTDK